MNFQLFVNPNDQNALLTYKKQKIIFINNTLDID